MRVCFYTLGCKVNLNETGALEQMFRANGFTIAQENEPADVFVVNSCTVTNFGDQKSRKWLRRKKRENPGAVTVLTGCYPQAFPDEAAEIAEADVVTGSGNRHAILTDVQKVLNGEEERDQPLVLINPELVWTSAEKHLNEEGCLSVPGIYDGVERSIAVKVKALDENGASREIAAEGMLAICMQHEMDHLLGKVFVEYLSPLKRNRIKTKLVKAQKQAAKE